jgi:hypothetical protein
MKTYIIIRHELIESFGYVEAENESDARKKWENGSVDMELADDTTERGPILVYEENPEETGPEPLPLDSMKALSERVRILREALADNLQAWEGEEESVREEHADLIEETRAALEATKEGA